MTSTVTLEWALARITELETQLAGAPKRRQPRKASTAECQWCGDTTAVKGEHLGLPLCADWKKCASRAKRKGSTPPMFLRLTGNPYRSVKHSDGHWLATWNGDVIGVAGTQAEVRQLGWVRFTAERDAAEVAA